MRTFYRGETWDCISGNFQYWVFLHEPWRLGAVCQAIRTGLPSSRGFWVFRWCWNVWGWFVWLICYVITCNFFIGGRLYELHLKLGLRVQFGILDECHMWRLWVGYCCLELMIIGLYSKPWVWRMWNYIILRVNFEIVEFVSHTECERNLGRTQFFTHRLAVLRLPPSDLIVKQ